MMAGTTRRRRNRAPQSESAGDSTVVKYSTIGSGITTDSSGLGYTKRFYIPGNATGLAAGIGPALASYYSTGKFTPGTTIRWEPSVSFTTSGRVYVGFTDNPEVIAAINVISPLSSYVAAVKSLGDVVSFPVWQETDVHFPTKLRRKMFDTNSTADTTDANVLDRSCQITMFAAIDGTPASTSLGGFWYHDRIHVEGIQSVLT